MCFGCGEAGHIRPNCPNRMRAVREEGVESGILVDGFLAGIEAKGLRIDTGSGRTVVYIQILFLVRLTPGGRLF